MGGGFDEIKATRRSAHRLVNLLNLKRGLRRLRRASSLSDGLFVVETDIEQRIGQWDAKKTQRRCTALA